MNIAYTGKKIPFFLLNNNIERGGYHMKKATIHDVAKKAGVSVTTVSRVLNNRGYISDEMKKK